jgi:hypothetical protein
VAIVLGEREPVNPRDIPMSEVRERCRIAAERHRVRGLVAPVVAARAQLQQEAGAYGLRLDDNEATRIAVAIVTAYLAEV